MSSRIDFPIPALQNGRKIFRCGRKNGLGFFRLLYLYTLLCLHSPSPFQRQLKVKEEAKVKRKKTPSGVEKDENNAHIFCVCISEGYAR